MQLTYIAFDFAETGHGGYASMLCLWFAGMRSIITEATDFCRAALISSRAYLHQSQLT
jgi:hypothetical protein